MAKTILKGLLTKAAYVYVEAGTADGFCKEWNRN